MKTNKKKMKLHHRYGAELNRCIGDNIARAVRYLERRGYVVDRVPQLTTITIELPRDGSFTALKADLLGVLQPRRGSLVLWSTSGRSWSCSMRGNMPGIFDRIH